MDNKTYQKLYREAHREELKAYAKKYRKEHKEKLNADCRKYHQEHKEVLNAKSREYWKEHKDEQNEKRRTDETIIKRRRELDKARYAEHRKMYTTAMYKLPSCVEILDSKHVIFNGVKFGISSKGYLKHEDLDLHVALMMSKGHWFEGCNVHHIDGDVFNNMLDNLICLTKEKHIEAHKLMKVSMEAYMLWIEEQK